MPTARTCIGCGESFEAVRADRRYCNPKCATKNSERRCEVEDCARPHAAKGLCQKHYRDQSPSGAKWRRGNPETRRAALRRKTQKRRALIFDPTAEDIDRDEIGERDGWVCGLCSEAVDQDLTYPNPSSASLDHVLPLSLGGKHVVNNVQISHLTCNIAKGNRVA